MTLLALNVWLTADSELQLEILPDLGERAKAFVDISQISIPGPFFFYLNMGFAEASMTCP